MDQFNERKVNHKEFYFPLIDNIHPFYDGKGRTCKKVVGRFISSSYKYTKKNI